MRSACPTCGATIDASTVDVSVRGGSSHFHVLTWEVLRFGRGGASHGVDIRLGSHPNMSRVAGELTNRGAGVVVRSRQLASTGWITVLVREVAVARLAQNDEYALRDPEFQVRLTVTDGSVSETSILDVSQPSGAPPVNVPSPTATVGALTGGWSQHAVLHPAPGTEWRTVVAIACVLTESRQGDQLKFGTLKRRCEAVLRLGALSDRWLSKQLERAMVVLEIEGSGDRIPRIVSTAQSLRLVPDEILTVIAGVLDR